MAKYRQAYRCGPDKYEVAEARDGWRILFNGVHVDTYKTRDHAENDVYLKMRDHAAARKRIAVDTLAAACVDLHELGITSSNLAKFATDGRQD